MNDVNDYSKWRVLRADEYADLFRVNPQTVRQLIRNGEIPYYRFSGSLRIPNPVFKGEQLPEILKPQEFADEFRIAPSTVRKSVQAGDIPAERIGGSIRIWRPPEPTKKVSGTDSPAKNSQPHASAEQHEPSN